MSARLDIWLILGCWIVFAAYWAIAAIGAKPNLGVRGWRREGGLRLALIVLTLLLLRVPSVREALRQLQRDGAGIAVFTGAAGVALCALGMTLAIWARIHLGRNWGVPMSRKEDPELVTPGSLRLYSSPDLSRNSSRHARLDARREHLLAAAAYPVRRLFRL